MGVLGEEQSVNAYIRAIKDMYERVKMRVKTPVGDTEDFLIDIGLHQGSALSPFLFTIVLDELIKGIQDKVPWCMLFAGNIVLIDETRVGVLNVKLEQRRDIIVYRGFRLNRFNTEYIKCGFSGVEGSGEEVTMGSVTILNFEKFRYLGSIIE